MRNIIDVEFFSVFFFFPCKKNSREHVVVNKFGTN